MFQQFVGVCKKVGRAVVRGSKKAAVVTIGTAAAVSSAHAALPPAVATTITEIQDNAEAMFALAFPVVATITGLMIVIKLFKRFSNKA